MQTTQALRRGAMLHNNYRIESVLGQGGFGITYLAHDLSLDIQVAVKEYFPRNFCMRDGATSQVSVMTEDNAKLVERFKQKFLKEAKSIAKLEHPNIIKIYTAFEENDTAYYVMPYIDGCSLSEEVRANGPLSEARAVRYITQVGRALEYIHSEHINHLDVKPGNIMLRRKDDTPILIDFGLAKQYDEAGQQTSTTPVGISHGFAPFEQYKNGGVSSFSPVTDVYSLGATLYFLLSGIVPPQAPDLIDSELTFPDSIPFRLKSPIEKAMSASRTKRYQSVGEFLRAIDGESVTEDTVVGPQPQPEPRPQPEPQEESKPKPKSTIRPTFTLQPTSKPDRPFRKRVSLAAVVVLSIVLYLINMVSSHEQSSKPNEDIPWRSVAITPTEEEQIAQTTVTPTRTQTEQTMTTPTTQMTQTTTSPKPTVSVKKSGNVTTFTFNGVSFDMVNVKGGIFLMGSSASEAESYEKPTHHEVVESFMIGKTEVTQALWKAVMGTNPSQFKGDYLPVETVTWDDCQKFISRLKDITGKKFRLPTETEWEYAARGGNQNHGYKYSGSNDINSVAWYRDISDNKTHGIATKAPNELGLYDMSGNVWEWTSDKWCDDYNSPRNGGNNGNFYVCRGGGYSNDSSCSRVAFRAGAPSDHGYNNFGFRLALDY